MILPFCQRTAHSHFGRGRIDRSQVLDVDGEFQFEIILFKSESGEGGLPDAQPGGDGYGCESRRSGRIIALHLDIMAVSWSALHPLGTSW